MSWQIPLNSLTRHAVTQNVEDYLSKDTDEYALIDELKARHRLSRIYRFDIGKNTDGYSDLIEGVLEMADLAGLCRENLVEYPDNHYQKLVKRMAAIFKLAPSCFSISAGLECMIDHICRSFLHPGAHFLLPIPNFSVFESFSLRSGASPLYLQLDKNQNFQWTEKTVEKMLDLIKEKQPALVWISNPVNPTGQSIPISWIQAVTERALAVNTAVVVDEAYGEYIDPDYDRKGAFSLVPSHPNLMVLRTFSKIHALPGIRVGYMMCGDPEIINAVKIYRPMFPFSWFSLFVAQTAVVDDEQPIKARQKTLKRKRELFSRLDTMADYQYLPTTTNTFMLRHRSIPADLLWQKLAARGMLTANLNGINGLQGEEFLRITIRARADNARLINALENVENKVC